MPLTRLLRLLTLIAMLFAPVSMSASHAATAMPAAPAVMADHMAAAPAGHCADMEGRQDKQGPIDPNIDCMIACSAMPASEFEVEAQAIIAAFIEPAGLTGALHGLDPGSDPPPPRFS